MCRPNDELYVVDRREGAFFVLTGADGRETAVPELPEGACAGDVLRRTAQGWTLCADETAARRARMREKKERLFRRGDTLRGQKGV